MADTPIKGGLSTDPRAINFYGAQDEDVSEYQKSLDDSIKALQQRYEQPNWFNVAAGFFKPQLGGFAASLGSASEALGQNLEKQREAQLPIAQMRSQLAMSKVAMGQNKQAADLVKAHEAEGAPLHQLPDLVAKLNELGSPLAAGPKARLDEARKSQETMIQRANLIKASNETTLQKIASDLAANVITPADAAVLKSKLPAIPDVPDLFAVPPPKNKTDAGVGSASATDAAATAAAAAAAAAAAKAAATSGADTSGATTAKTSKAKIVIPPTVDVSPAGTVGMMPEARQLKVEEAKTLQKKGQDTFSNLQAIAAPENFNKFVTPVDNSLRLLGYEPDPEKTMDAKVQAKNQKMAQEAMGMMKGNLWKAALSSIQEGLTGKVGDLYMNLSAPVRTFIKSAKNQEMQDYMSDLMQNFAQVAIQKQQLGGLNPSTGRNVEFNLFGESSPTMEHSTPQSALKNLLHMRTALYQTKSQHDFVQNVLSNNHPEYGVDVNSPTKAYDIVNHPAYIALQKPWADAHADIERHFSKGP